MNFAVYFASRDEAIVLALIVVLGIASAVLFSLADARRERLRSEQRISTVRRCQQRPRHVRLVVPEHTKEPA